MANPMTADDRAAMRAFLQRCEVRLSTLHRVATAMLSGAGLMVLLPTMMKDQIAGVGATLLMAERSATHTLLALIAGIVLALPLAVFFLLLRDLTRFYFHADHVQGADGTLFVPRFTLTGLRIAHDEMSEGAQQELEAARASQAALELIVPQSTAGRTQVDRRLAAYGLDHTGLDDHARAAGLFVLVQSRSRLLADEVVKLEFGMARHLVRLQVIVIRYVKSLLVFLVTALTVFAAAAVTSRNDPVGAEGQLWLTAIFAAWAPVVTWAVSSPVRWVESMLRADGATSSPVTADPEFTKVERVVIAVGGAVLGLATIVVLDAGRRAGGVDTEVAITGAWLAAAVIAYAATASRSVTMPQSLGGRSG